jgi:hypothetical protein
MLSIFREMNTERIENYGIGEQGDIQKFGAESIFPKLGYAFTLMPPLLDPNNLGPLKNYTGVFTQHALKIGWAYARDVHVHVNRRSNQNPLVRAAGRLSARRRAEDQLAATYAKQRLLADFVAGLKPEEKLGSSLDEWMAAHPRDIGRLFGILRGFARDIVAVLREKVSDDPAVGLVDRMNLGLKRQDEAKFAHWRDVNFRESVRAAQRRGIRYAGMGSRHSEFVRRILGEQPGLHYYALNGADYRRDLALTNKRTEELRRAAAGRGFGSGAGRGRAPSVLDEVVELRRSSEVFPV